MQYYKSFVVELMKSSFQNRIVIFLKKDVILHIFTILRQFYFIRNISYCKTNIDFVSKIFLNILIKISNFYKIIWLQVCQDIFIPLSRKCIMLIHRKNWQGFAQYNYFSSKDIIIINYVLFKKWKKKFYS